MKNDVKAVGKKRVTGSAYGCTNTAGNVIGDTSITGNAGSSTTVNINTDNNAATNNIKIASKNINFINMSKKLESLGLNNYYINYRDGYAVVFNSPETFKRNIEDLRRLAGDN